MSSKLEPTIWSHGTGQGIPCFDRCQLTITWMSSIKDVCCKLARVWPHVGYKYKSIDYYYYYYYYYYCCYHYYYLFCCLTKFSHSWPCNFQPKNAGWASDFHFGIHGGVDGRMVTKTKFSRTDHGLPYFLTHGAPCACRALLVYHLMTRQYKNEDDLILSQNALQGVLFLL